MDLAKAATKFAKTPVAGWNGVDWDEEVSFVTLLPFDRFISERDFGNKRRHLLVPVEDSALDAYSVIRFSQTNAVYMLGYENQDIFVNPYSKVRLIHRAAYYGTLYEFTHTTAASGMKATATRSSVGDYWCDVERITFQQGKEFDNVSYTQNAIILPRNCPVDTDHELAAADRFHDITEVSVASGFKVCRAIQKRSE